MPSFLGTERDVDYIAGDILNSIESLIGKTLAMSGWIAVIDGDLYLLEYNYVEEYEQSKMLRIADRDIIFCIREKILPLGGGKSFLFHKAKITGSLLICRRQQIEIAPQDLLVEERGGDFVRIDIDPESVKRAREKYEGTLSMPTTRWSGDWLDLVSPITPTSPKDGQT